MSYATPIYFLSVLKEAKGLVFNLKTNPKQLPSRDLAVLPMIPTHEEIPIISNCNSYDGDID